MATLFALQLALLARVAPRLGYALTALIAPPTQNAGLALAAAGTLCAVLLRRGVGVARGATNAPQRVPETIEVTHPPELRTRGI